MSGVLGDAEKLRFIPKEETLEKIQARWLFLRDNDVMPIDVKESILLVLYPEKCKTVEELRIFIKEYMIKNFEKSNTSKTHLLPYDKQLHAFYDLVIAGELKDWKHWIRYGKDMVVRRWYSDY